MIINIYLWLYHHKMHINIIGKSLRLLAVLFHWSSLAAFALWLETLAQVL